MGKGHITVLLNKSIEMLKVNEGDVIVDATLGKGGHSIEIAKKVGAKGKVIAFDVDEEAIKEFEKRLQAEYPNLKERFILINKNFAEIKQELKKIDIEKVDGVLADLGWRAEQIENEKYGLSFQQDAPLNMRLNSSAEEGLTAREIVNNWELDKLRNLFWEYGEERHAKQAAKAIIEFRKSKEIETTKELAEILSSKLGFFYRRSHLHPATKIFQALRIAVNEELANLEIFLSGAKKMLGKEKRLAVISFHSLEDRIVKQFFRANAGGCICPKEIPICVCGARAELKIITKKPIAPEAQEQAGNIRSRSAKLRVAEKIIN